MVQTRSRVAASRNTVTVQPTAGSSDSNSDSDASIPAEPRPLHVKSPVTLRPNKTPSATLNNGFDNKKRRGSATPETPARKRGRPRKHADPKDEDEIDEAAMDAVNAFNNRRTPQHKPHGIEILLRSTGKPNPSRRRLDGTSIDETIGETPQFTKLDRRLTPMVEDSEPEDDLVEEEDDIDNRNQDVNRELGSPELDSSPPKPQRQSRRQRSPARLQPAPAVLVASPRPRTINNLRPPTPSKRAGNQQHASLSGQILPSVEVDDVDASAHQADGNVSETEEAEESYLDDAEDGRQEDGDVEDLEEDDAHFHPPIHIRVPEFVDKRLIVTLESVHLNSLRSLMGKDQWTDLGSFWELEIHGADGFHFDAESPPLTSSGQRCLRALYALRRCVDELKSPTDLGSQNEHLIRLQNPLNFELTNVARKIAKLRQALGQPGKGQQEASSDTQQFVIPTLVLTLRDLFLLGTVGRTLTRHAALPLLPPRGTFTCTTVQYVTSITKRLSSLVRDLMEYCEDEEAGVQLGWNVFSQTLDKWKFEIQEKIGAVNEEMSRQEKIARDRAIKERKRRLEEIELAKFNEQWNRMAASTQAMKHQPRPMALKQRLTDQYISPPQESVSPSRPPSRSRSGRRPYSSFIETAHARISASQHHRPQAPSSRPQGVQIRSPRGSQPRQVGLPRSSQDALPLPSPMRAPATKSSTQAPPPQPQQVQPRIHAPWKRRRVGLPRGQTVTPVHSTIRPSIRQHPATQPHASSRPTVRPQEENTTVIDSSPEPEPFAVPDHIATPSKQARPQVELQVEEFEDEEAADEDEGLEEKAHELDDDEDEEAFARVWENADKAFLVEQLEEAASRGITKDDLEDWADCFDCSVSEVRRQISSLRKEGLWQGSL